MNENHSKAYRILADAEAFILVTVREIRSGEEGDGAEVDIHSLVPPTVSRLAAVALAMGAVRAGAKMQQHLRGEQNRASGIN